MPEDNIQQKDALQLSLNITSSEAELRNQQLEAAEAEDEMDEDGEEDFEDDDEEDEDY